MIGEITKAHTQQILRMNQHFVHWLAPLGRDELDFVLGKATYARQINNGQGVLIGYGHDVDYPEHENMQWLSKKFDKFFYIDRVIIDENARGRGFGRKLYEDLECFARAAGYPRLTCEVNTIPNNSNSHIFHKRMGFNPCGEQVYKPGVKAVGYYVKQI